MAQVLTGAVHLDDHHCILNYTKRVFCSSIQAEITIGPDIKAKLATKKKLEAEQKKSLLLWFYMIHLRI